MAGRGEKLPRFATKQAAREYVWEELVRRRAARFPFPPRGRIPNFEGAEEAARRLFSLPLWRGVRAIKVNPDAPQRPVRAEALRRGIVLFVPTPRLRGGFWRLDPARIPAAEVERAAVLSNVRRYGEPVGLEELPRVDLVVTGSVAVTPAGKRCGKGEGYGDLEYAILRELGHPPAPVVTTVHDLQIVADFPRDPNDLPLSWIVTPTRTLQVRRPLPPPRGIDWSLLDEEDLRRMPVLRELRRRT
ncbi:MAG: 5-formyltetrahydrofolate cyclo-ligase [Candidatus Binatia bacterium]|nr:MAG: 5-formyltetrahydrofolate cyclo-ligase [Candidatus Binatia bacterium]